MNISAYILDYLKQFGTVTVPKFGVFSLENSKAVINSENGSILPPSSKIAFHSDYQVSSDDLVDFISNKKSISKEAAENELQIQTDFWKKKLQAEHTLEIQNLGTIFLEDGELHFNGNRLESDHPDFYGLEEIKFSDIHNSEKPNVSVNPEKDYKFNQSILWIFLFIIPVAGILAVAYTQQDLLFGKKSFSVQTKTHRIVQDTIKMQVHTPKAPISDSLKKDSLVKPAEKVEKITKTQPTQNNTKTKWQK